MLDGSLARATRPSRTLWPSHDSSREGILFALESFASISGPKPCLNAVAASAICLTSGRKFFCRISRKRQSYTMPGQSTGGTCVREDLRVIVPSFRVDDLREMIFTPMPQTLKQENKSES